MHQKVYFLKIALFSAMEKIILMEKKRKKLSGAIH